MNISSYEKSTHPGKLPPADQLGFGSVFTDHMFLMDYTDQDGLAQRAHRALRARSAFPRRQAFCITAPRSLRA